MRKPTTFLPALALGVAGAITMAAASMAAPITYTETATASGSLNGVAFTDASVLLRMVNDTTLVVGGPDLFENFGILTVSLNGGIPVTFTDQMEVFSAQTVAPPTVGFSDLTSMLDVLDDGSVFFLGYDLRTAIGPITGNPALSSLGQPFPTTGGDFILTSIANDASTFTATTVAVPAPPIGGLAVLITFGGAIFGARLLERRRARHSHPIESN
jgi:hypothetical protein